VSRAWIFVAALLSVGACGGDDDTSTSAETASAASTQEDVADEYALGKSGGERTGCSTAAPGAEAEANAGCIYSVSFAGCLEGLTGESIGPLPIEEEFPDEPALVELYRQAVADCSN
jgi:hypothetical protein